MCTFQSDREVMVCDVANDSVRSHLNAAIPSAEFTIVDGQGTVVRATNDVDHDRFRDVIRTAIEIANRKG